MKLITNQTSKEGYYIRLKLPFSKTLNELIKQFPGRKFDWDAKQWLIPVDCYSYLRALYPRLPDTYFSKTYPASKGPKLNLFPHQIEAVHYLEDNGAWLAAFEAGLGKTHVALEHIIRLPPTARVAVVTQASLLPQWEAYVTSIIYEGGTREGPEVNLSSYEMSKNLTGPYDLIVLDESQNIANPKAKRTKEVMRLRDESPNGKRLALSATPIPDDPQDIWTTLDFLFPGRFGTFYQFCERYCNKEEASDSEGNVYGTSFWGINSHNAKELGERLSWCGSFISKTDVGNILPKITINRVDTDKPAAHAALLSTPNSVILTWHRKLAAEIAEILGVTHIDGTTPEKKRQEIVASSASRAIVATTGSMGTGTNAFLEKDRAIIAELAWSPKFFSQSIGRFARIGGKDATITILVTKETDIIAIELERKLAAIGSAKPLGLSEKLATTALEQTDYKSRLASLEMEEE